MSSEVINKIIPKKTFSRPRLASVLLILVLLVGVFVPIHFALASWYNPVTWPSYFFPNPGELALALIGYVMEGILMLMSFVLGLAGYLLNFVLKYTIVDMAARISGGVTSDGTTIATGFTGINTVWKVIRDLMNIAFIFFLVYEGILMIIGRSDTAKIKKFITGIVLASLLINFSLFFTKVLIDASNIVTIGIYNSILGTDAVAKDYGLSDPIIKSLGLASFYDSSAPADFGANKRIGGILIMGLGSATLILVASFVFFAVSILFIIRYITLIILLMLSPIAYMGLALPFMEEYAKKWWTSFKGQLLFAPIYMLMTWVVLTLMTSDGFLTKGKFTDIFNNPVKTDFTAMSLLLNFTVVIGLLIASLVITKSTASKGSELIGKATGNLTAFAGNKVMGGSAWVGRKTLGWTGNKIADSATLQEKASSQNKNLASRMLAKTALYTARTGRDATFDIRNASVPGMPNVTPIGSYMAGITGVGKGDTKGYKQEKEEKDKKKREKDAVNANELALVQAKQAVIDGAKNGATPAQIDAMEKALAKLSDKQTETFVASNRELLDKLNFANAISVKQLEAINKSDQFSDSEKDGLKGKRFSQIASINDTAGLAAIAVRTAGTRALTPTEVAAAKTVDDARKQAKGLSDSELEMIDSEYLDATSTDPIIQARAQEFISQLRPGQVDTIINNKGGKFTSTQKTNVKDERMRPLRVALGSPRTPAVQATIRSLVKKADIKTKISYLKTPPVPGAVNIGWDPDVLTTYDVKTLQRMALHDDMSADDISTLRARLLGTLAVSTAVKDWLTDPNKGEIEFPA